MRFVCVHVLPLRACPFAPHHGQLYGSQEQFEIVSRERRLDRLHRFLTAVERGTRNMATTC